MTKPFICTYCGYQATQNSNLNTHVKTIHKGYRYECSECDYKATQSQSLKIHVKAQHRDIKYECKECGQEFKFKGSLNKHMKLKHGNSSAAVQCNICGSMHSSRGNMESHVNSVHKKIKYDCDICFKKFSRKYSVTNHIRIVHLKKKVYCSHCNQSYSETAKLNKHVLMVHGNGVRDTFICDSCDYIAKRKDQLKQHKEAVHEGKIYQCNFCDHTSPWERSLRSHMEHIHGDKVKCELCGKRFVNNREYEKHINRSHSATDKLFKCIHCEFETLNYEELQPHRRKNHWKSFMSKKTKKKEKCPYCDKEISMSRTNQLKEHINNVHLQIKTHQCRICEKKFAQLTHLRNHINSIHNKAKYKCDSCDLEYNQPSGLFKHRKLKHKQ